MEIVGHGFLATSLRTIAQRHPDTVAVAAGVSSGNATSKQEFDREAALLRRTARRCEATGKRLVFFSTSSFGIYGAADGAGEEDRHVVPCTPYGRHKLAIEQQLATSRVQHLTLRLSSPVGPHQPAHQLVPGLVRAIDRGRVRLQRGAVRDLIDVADVVAILDLLLTRSRRSETVNIASGVSVPVERIVDHLEDRLGSRAYREYRGCALPHVISTSKLRDRVPEVAGMRFDLDYYRHVLDNYVAAAMPAGAR